MSDIQEKVQAFEIVHDERSVGSPELKSAELEFPDVNPKRVMLKMDLTILPMVSILYLLAFLDRGNIGNAKIEGLAEDLNLQGNQYNLCLTMFFIPYALLEIPSNMALRKLRPSIWLPLIMVAWGTVMTLMGLVHNFQGLLAARIFLGVTEAGLYPGVAFYLTMFYRREELLFRQSLFCSSASIAGAFSGILAYGIAHMNGVGNKPGWAWIFILEGLVTVLVAGFSYFFLCDSPDKLRVLNDREREYLAYKLRDRDYDGQPVDNSIQSEVKDDKILQLKATLKDPQIYIHTIIWLAVTCPIYGISLFLPTIIKTIGWTSAVSQLMTVPIYVAAAVVSISLAWVSDKVQLRSPFIIFSIILELIGFIMALTTDVKEHPKVLYGAMVLAAVGCYSTFPASVTWLASNLGHTTTYKRAIAMAFQIGIGNLGGAYASNFYRQQDAPRYKLGHGLEILFAGMGLIAAVIMVFTYKYWNKQKQRDLAAGKFDNYTAQELRLLCDKSPYFEYML